MCVCACQMVRVGFADPAALCAQSSLCSNNSRSLALPSGEVPYTVPYRVTNRVHSSIPHLPHGQKLLLEHGEGDSLEQRSDGPVF